MHEFNLLPSASHFERQIYADWLEENGQIVRSAAVRSGLTEEHYGISHKILNPTDLSKKVFLRFGHGSGDGQASDRYNEGLGCGAGDGEGHMSGDGTGDGTADGYGDGRGRGRGLGYSDGEGSLYGRGIGGGEGDGQSEQTYGQR